MSTRVDSFSHYMRAIEHSRVDVLRQSGRSDDNEVQDNQVRLMFAGVDRGKFAGQRSKVNVRVFYATDRWKKNGSWIVKWWYNRYGRLPIRRAHQSSTGGSELKPQD